MGLLKEITARKEKTSWLGSVTVYTTHFIRAGLVFPAPVPILPVLGLPLYGGQFTLSTPLINQIFVLPFHKVRARLKFWSGTGEIWYGKVIYTLKFYPSRATFFGTRTIFIRAVPKISCSVNGPYTDSYMRLMFCLLLPITLVIAGGGGGGGGKWFTVTCSFT